MVDSVTYKNSAAYKCGVCGFLYSSSEDAKECEEHCRTHASCSMEITKRALK